MKFATKVLLLSGAGMLTAASAFAQTAEVQDYERGTVLDVPTNGDTAATAPQILPRRAISKADVRRQHGQPERVFAPVGDPPITRWDYPGFRVFFEYDRVLHSVVPGDFPVITHRDQLDAGR